MQRKSKSLPPPAWKKIGKGVTELQPWNTTPGLPWPKLKVVKMSAPEYKIFSDDPIAYVKKHRYFHPYKVERLIHSRHHSPMPKGKVGNGNPAGNPSWVVVFHKGIDCTTFAQAYEAVSGS